MKSKEGEEEEKKLLKLRNKKSSFTMQDAFDYLCHQWHYNLLNLCFPIFH